MYLTPQFYEKIKIESFCYKNVCIKPIFVKMLDLTKSFYVAITLFISLFA